MSDRRSQILDAAIELLGTQGVRALTHRAVDELAQLPTGSTSNVFRTRDALLIGVADRIVDLEREAFEAIAGSDVPLTRAELAAVLARVVQEAVGPRRAVTAARFAILVESAIRPELQQTVAQGGGRVNQWSTQWLKVAGAPDPARDQAVVANYVTGLTLHELAHPTPGFDPTERLTDLLTTLLERP